MGAITQPFALPEGLSARPRYRVFVYSNMALSDDFTSVHWGNTQLKTTSSPEVGAQGPRTVERRF